MEMFYGRKMSDEFTKFVQFAKKHVYFWEEFAIINPDTDSILEDWTNSWEWSGADINKAKQDLIPLGQADGMGSYFAFWDEGKGKELHEMPVIILGSEGELPIVAKNLKELMLLMTSQEELILTDNKALWCSEDSFGNCNEDFAKFIKSEFGLTPLKNEDEGCKIINEASESLSDDFEKWARIALNPNFVYQKKESEESKDAFIQLYYAECGETIDSLEQNMMNTLDKQPLFFIRWSIVNGFTNLGNDQDIEKLRTNEISIIDFLRKHLNRSFISLSDYVKDNGYDDFFWNYYENMSGHDVYWERDFAYTFLDDPKLRDNYMGAKAEKELDLVEYNAENFQKIDEVLKMRYKEYQEHQFEKSKKTIK